MKYGRRWSPYDYSSRSLKHVGLGNKSTRSCVIPLLDRTTDLTKKCHGFARLNLFNTDFLLCCVLLWLMIKPHLMKVGFCFKLFYHKCCAGVNLAIEKIPFHQQGQGIYLWPDPQWIHKKFHISGTVTKLCRFGEGLWPPHPSCSYNNHE